MSAKVVDAIYCFCFFGYCGPVSLYDRGIGVAILPACSACRHDKVQANEVKDQVEEIFGLLSSDNLVDEVKLSLSLGF